MGGPVFDDLILRYRSDQDSLNPGEGLPSFFWLNAWASGAFADAGFGNLTSPLTTLQLLDGDFVSFKRVGADWVQVTNADAVRQGPIYYPDNTSPVKYVLKEGASHFYLLDPIQHRVFIFEKLAGSPVPLRVATILDQNENGLYFIYSGNNIRPDEVYDDFGRSLSFAYTLVDFWWNSIDSVTDHAGRTVSFARDGGIIVDSFTDPMGQRTRFTYSAESPISGVIEPRGNTPTTQTFEWITSSGCSANRITSQTDALLNTTTFSYGGGNPVTVVLPDGGAWVYEHYSHHGRPKSITDPTGKVINFTKNSDEQVTAVTDRKGDSTTVQYHSQTGKLASVTNARGNTVSFTYSSQNQEFVNPANGEDAGFTLFNLTRIDFPDGTYEQRTYDARGNLVTRVDRAGQTWAYTYNTNGQVLTATNPTGGVVTATYTLFPADAGDAGLNGALASLRDSDTDASVFAYDAVGRVVRVTHPDSTFRAFTYNTNGKVTSVTNERGFVTRLAYDSNGNQTLVTDARDASVNFTYDALDRIASVTDKNGAQTTLAYDAVGRLARVTDPNSNASTRIYDIRGWLSGISNAGGQTWRIPRDDEGVASGFRTPLDAGTTIATDKLGRVVSVTDPSGGVTQVTRDTMSRITSAVDPAGRTTTLTRDGRGRLTGVSASGGISASFQRNTLGRVTRVTDPKGANWDYTYTPMGRLASATDPPGATWQYAYDARGRLRVITHPGVETETITYDGTNNIVRRQFSSGADLNFTYDELDRLTSANGVTLSYDSEGRVTGTTESGVAFAASYDPAGRLTSVGYNGGAFSVTYGYDTRNRLTSVTDNLTSTTVTFSYDNADRRTGVTRPNNVNGVYTYDSASRLVRIQDGTAIDIQYTYDQAGRVVQVIEQVPLGSGPLLAPRSDSVTFGAASQPTSPGYTYDARGRRTAAPSQTFTWDGPSRLSSIDAVTFTHDGLGNLATRSENSNTTRFFHNHALRRSPIVAERVDPSGPFTRYYVYTPRGELLYLIDAAQSNSVAFFHFDRLGSTLALTNAAGAVTDAYAYGPWGDLLGHTGSSTQPFTFLGRYGVRQEGTTGRLFQMRARTYDARLGQFLSRDPKGPRLAEPRSLNRYAYAYGDPLGRIDVSGREPEAVDSWSAPENGPGILRELGLDDVFPTPFLGVFSDLPFANGEVPAESPFEVGLRGAYKIAYWQRGHLSVVFGVDVDLSTHVGERESQKKLASIVADVLPPPFPSISLPLLGDAQARSNEELAASMAERDREERLRDRKTLGQIGSVLWTAIFFPGALNDLSVSHADLEGATLPAWAENYTNR